MPKLPRGMFWRGSSYYTRRRIAGRDRWFSLGPEYGAACRKLAALRNGQASLGVRTTVAQVARRWLAVYVPTARSEKNARMSGTRVDMYLGRFMGYRPLGKVSPEDMREYRLWLERREIKPATVMHLLSDARCFFNWCVEAGYLDKSPFPRRLMPRIQERPPDRLTDAEVVAVLGVPEPWGFVIRLGLGTGLRWGELTRAQASDVEQGMLVVSQTKSGRVRRVPLPAEVQGEVRLWVGRLVGYSVKSPGSFATRVRRLSGVAGFHVHQLRHTFACRWLERGGSLVALQQVLGHASVVTTQRYARLTDEMVRREAERIGGAQCG